MSKFRFRLETLQKLREVHRDELRGKLAEALHAQQVLEEQLTQVDAEFVNLLNLRRHVITSGEVQVEQLLEAQRYQGVLLAQQTTMREQSRLLSAEVDRRRQAVVEADRQVKMLQNLRERQLADFQHEQQRAETKVLDEVAARGGQEVDSWPA